VKIACSKCLLRPLEMSDAGTLARHANERGVWRNLRDRFPHPYSEADALAYIEHVRTRSVQTSFGIEVDGHAIGSISLMVGEDIARQTAEVGYWIGREFWGRDIMVDGVRATTQYAFETLGLVRVFAVPFVNSTRSSRVLEKAGYAKEGMMRRSAVKDGQILDQWLYTAYSDAPLP
jgi:[ribosomal protein S5]-alanine N-acetyltransferase